MFEIANPKLSKLLMKKFLSVLVLSFMMVGCNQPQSSDDVKTSDTPPKSEVIKIGGIAPLSGDAASYGIMTQNIINMKTEELNAKGGINGRSLKILWEDGKCNPGDASRAAQKLIGVDKVSIILGGQCSGETLGAAPITEKKKVILLSPLSSSPEITHAGDYVFRTAPSDLSQATALAKYANNNYEKIGIINEQTDYAVASADNFEAHFSGEVIRESYLSTDSDFKTIITKLKNSKIEALVVIPQSPPKFDIIAKQLVEQNWESPLLIGEVAAGNTEVIQKHKKLLAEVGTIAANFVAPNNEEFNTFVKSYNEKIGKAPDYLNYTATVLDAFGVLKKVLTEVQNEKNTKAIRDALYATQNYESLFGKLAFDSNGDVSISYSLFEFNGEEFIPLSE